MKIVAGLVIAANAVDIDRKVPPRHPKNRLARLEKFCEALMAASWVESDRFAKLGARCESWANARFAAFDKCGHYDSDSKPHGGPNKDVPYKPTNNNYWGEEKQKLDVWAEDRKRRSADDCSDWDGNMDGINYFMFKDVVEKETVRVQNDNPCAPDYIDSAWLGKDYVNLVQEELMEDCEDDCSEDGDASCENKCKQASRSGGSRVKRIENRGPWRSARSIVTGMRKWGERYLAECPGHRSGRHMLRRQNFMITCTRKFVSNQCTHADCNEEYGRNFSWGGKNLKQENPYLN